MQRADESIAAQATLMHEGVGMRTNIIEREQPLFMAAEYDALLADLDSQHFALLDLFEVGDRMPTDLCHVTAP